MDVNSSAPLLLVLSFSLILHTCHSNLPENRQTYVVYTGNIKKDEDSSTSYYTRMLEQVVDSKDAPKSMLYNYRRSFNGFVAKLTEKEAQKLAGLDGVVSVFPNEKRELHTTRSWDFIGFPQQVKRTMLENDIIVGVFDTGIWPESDSFSDKGFGPVPNKWKGTCQTSTNFSCNNKIIGAKYYHTDGSFAPEDPKSPRDSDGHGTHTASTAAGNLVNAASLFGLGQGTARGGVPSARIAVYKVCWSDGCYDADILAAFDDAIADGVDIISISIGASRYDYFKNPIAIGAFHAMRKGILTSCSGGNSGPDRSTVNNFSPWVLTVAASTIDRKFISKVVLGNNRTYEGIALNTFDLNGKIYPAIYGGDAPNTTAGYDGFSSRFCSKNSLDQNAVKGKIVLCDGRSSGAGSFLAGAVGMVTRGQFYRDDALSYPLPASYIGLPDGTNLYAYINSTRNATATILKSEQAKDVLAPSVALFSSRGPNPVTPDILKPDLVAPGVDILAAWSPISSISGVEVDNRVTSFNILSGTSMSCPHATGAAAYIKSFHPTWSPAAIKSALMTTAFPLSTKTNPDAEFAYGSGHIDPLKAVNPGLVYDVNETDYIKFLCGQGYGTTILQQVTGDNSSCSETTNGTVWDLNYPSFALNIPPTTSTISRSFNRIVTNVGFATSTYEASVTSPPGLKILVSPNVLPFSCLGQKLTFVLTVEGTLASSMASASLVWDDGTFQVRSPIIVSLAT